MGLGLQKCCAPTQNYYQQKALSKISDQYLGDIAQFSNVSHQVPNYQNVTHCCLVNKLMRYRIQFTDQLYPCSILLKEATWKRITSLDKSLKFGGPNFQLNFKEQKYQSPYASKTFIEAMEKMKRFPKLIGRIFPNHQVSPVGFYAVYFCMNGSVQNEERKQIVVDDYIPLDNYGEYLGSRVEEGTGIWCMIIEKALAKCLGSYQMIEYLTADQIFSQISGVPIPDIYHNNDFLISSFHQFGPEQSKYIRVGLSQQTNLLMAIWETCDEIQGKISSLTSYSGFRNQNNQKFIVDIIPEHSSQDYLQQQMKLNRLTNKLVVSSEKGDKIRFPKGRYIIHIFNRSREKVSCHFLIHSNLQVSPPTEVFGPTNISNKNNMIRRMYQKIHLSRAVVYQQLGIALRIAWLGPRAILCLKNETRDRKIVCVEIISSSIFFQDNKGQLKMQQLIQPNHHKIFMLLLRCESKSQQFGQFYRIHTRMA